MQASVSVFNDWLLSNMDILYIVLELFVIFFPVLMGLFIYTEEDHC